MKSRQSLPLQIDAQANLPVYAQIRQQITWLIASGELEPGTRLPTIRELAGQLKINMHTARQAYHALQDDGLVETGPGRGTRVLPIAMSKLISTASAVASHTVGVLLPNPTPFYAPLMLGLEETATRLGYLLITCFTHDSLETTRRLAQQLVSKNVDGLIAVAPVGDAVDPSRLPGLPIVSVDAPQVAVNSILFNLSGAGYESTRHLLWHGHKRIGLITAPLTAHSSREPVRGYKRALRAAGLTPDESLIVEVPGYMREFGYRAGQRMLELKKPPTAIFVSGDILAMGAMQALKDAGRRIPEDIAIASKDNIDFAGLIEPPLTTVSFPVFEMGCESMNMLHGIISGGAARKKKVLPEARLVVRRSCGCNRPAEGDG